MIKETEDQVEELDRTRGKFLLVTRRQVAELLSIEQRWNPGKLPGCHSVGLILSGLTIVEGGPSRCGQDFLGGIRKQAEG